MSKRIDYATAAQYIGVKVSALRNMVHRRQVPHIRLGPQTVRFDTDVLDAWLRERSVPVND